jgi:hypothetical protein
MDKIKVYLRNFNGVMDGILKSGEIDTVEDPRDAQAIVVWQDTRGEYVELANINKKYLHKPFIVVQHGAGATRDYEHPMKCPLLADKFCCWGQHDYERLVKQGNGDKGVITGSPLLKYIKPKEKHTDKNIVLVPIITLHEEPANLITFYEMKKAEIDHAQQHILKHKDELIKEWKPSILNPKNELEKEYAIGLGSIPYYDVNRNFRVISKLTTIHDKNLYLGSVCETSVASSTHIEDCVKLLLQTDVVVGMVESTFQMLAMAMDIPVVVCREWEFKEYGGLDYTECDHIKTDAAVYAETKDLRKAIEQELSNPERLKEERKKTVLRELGDINSDPDKNIIEVIRREVNG